MVCAFDWKMNLIRRSNDPSVVETSRTACTVQRGNQTAEMKVTRCGSQAVQQVSRFQTQQALYHHHVTRRGAISCETNMPLERSQREWMRTSCCCFIWSLYWRRCCVSARVTRSGARCRGLSPVMRRRKSWTRTPTRRPRCSSIISGSGNQPIRPLCTGTFQRRNPSRYRKARTCPPRPVCFRTGWRSWRCRRASQRLRRTRRRRESRDTWRTTATGVTWLPSPHRSRWGFIN